MKNSIKKQEFIDRLEKTSLTIILGEEGFDQFIPFLYSELKDKIFKLDKNRSHYFSTFHCQYFFCEDKTFEEEKQLLMSLIGNRRIIAENLLGLYIYLDKIQTFPYLLIEYPEQNLHPSKQVKLARLLARLVNHGIKLIILTHSDYIIKELNNLIMLYDKEDSSEIKQKYGYSDIELLNPNTIKAYEIIDNKIIKAEIIEEGIICSVIDEIIIKQRQISDDIYYSLAYTDNENEQK